MKKNQRSVAALVNWVASTSHNNQPQAEDMIDMDQHIENNNNQPQAENMIDMDQHIENMEEDLWQDITVQQEELEEPQEERRRSYADRLKPNLAWIRPHLDEIDRCWKGKSVTLLLYCRFLTLQ
jgi:hypothetical protein